MRALAPLLLAAAAASCVSFGRADDEQPAQLRAPIAPGVTLTLPTPPNYPEARSLQQTLRARFGERSGAFESFLSLAPDRVVIIITAPSGPRLATITWDAAGVRDEKLPLAPDLPAANILADIFICLWPPDAVAAALPEGYNLVVGEAGVREVRSTANDHPILAVTPDPADASRYVVHNYVLGYEVAISSRALE